MSNDVIYFKGGFVPADEAMISVKTHAFLYGTSLFEGIRAYWVPEKNALSIFRMKEHYQRLVENARIFMMPCPLDVDALEQNTVELLKRNAPTTDTYIRPTLYKSCETIGPGLNKEGTDLTLWSAPLGQYVDTSKGLSVMTSSWRRVDDNAIPPRAKAGGAYMNTALIVTEARTRGYDDAIVLSHDGHVSEGSAMNLFLVRRIDGELRLITPAITENILEGITRDTIITLAREKFGIETDQRQVDRTELYRADEVFFCGTGAQVAPVTQIDDRPVGTGTVGAFSKKLQDLYFEVVKAQHPDYAERWCTLVPVTSQVTA